MFLGLFCRLGDRLPMSSVYFRHFRLCQLEFKNTALPKFGISKLECPKIGITFLLAMSSALPSSQNPKFGNRDLIPWFVPLRLPSIHRFGILLGWSWESIGMSSARLGSALLFAYTQSQVDHLSNFQSEVDHLLKIEVDQESKKNSS